MTLQWTQRRTGRLSIASLLLAITFVVGNSASLVAADESSTLVDQRKPGDLQRVQVTLEVRGKLRLNHTDDEKTQADMSATGQLAYQERLVTGANDATSTRPVIAGRLYEGAVTKVQVGSHTETVTLGDDQRMIMAESDRSDSLTSTGQPLSRKELDAIAVPGNSLVAYRLLPGKKVTVGETWAHQDADLAAILNIDEIIVNQVRSRLVSVERGLAKMQIAGTVTGNVDGAATEIKLQGDYRFDQGWGRLNWLQLTMEESRDANAATPGFEARAEMRMLASPLKEAPQLDPQTLSSAAQQLDRKKPFLRFESDENAYRLIHDEAWHLIDDRTINTSMRMVDGGKTIAQCNIRRLKKMEEGKQLGLDEFQSDIQKALGERFGEFAAAKKTQRHDGYEVLRVVAQGAVSEIPIRWVYYHLTSPEGERVAYVFTMENEMVERFASTDTPMIDSIQLGAVPERATSKSSKSESTASRLQPGSTR